MNALVLTRRDEKYEPSEICGIFLDVEEGKKHVEQMNIPYNEEFENYKKCEQCHPTDWFIKKSDEFKLSDTCDKASIKTDRLGVFCENQVNSDDVKSPRYGYYIVEVIDTK